MCTCTRSIRSQCTGNHRRIKNSTLKWFRLFLFASYFFLLSVCSCCCYYYFIIILFLSCNFFCLVSRDVPRSSHSRTNGVRTKHQNYVRGTARKNVNETLTKGIDTSLWIFFWSKTSSSSLFLRNVFICIL